MADQGMQIDGRDLQHENAARPISIRAISHSNVPAERKLHPTKHSSVNPDSLSFKT
jgi:hypothetical protein